MANKVPVTMGDLVGALARIERWVGDVHELLSGLDRNMQVAMVPDKSHGGDPEMDGECPPDPERSTTSTRRRAARKAPRSSTRKRARGAGEGTKSRKR